ncbi:Uma2 family endonuclease [Crocosphaera sp. UHCC 0190]|uniref:Uma2 family endonuclease n=1 Tax=Crocosphaera sp. UHCC 0190 TaxID=3110246 RepID=UPI002B2026AE|nr:Uma2 family endonuclease [Crocosphaera sp. UHCC 0190]MEA5512119.1 Uma2 family endonuclease [Crocosphaera sp. UHCC 0190]
MASLTQTSLTLDEFLSSPLANENYEFFDGELIQKMSPKRSHSRVQGKLLLLLENWSQNKGEVGIEWAICLKRNGKDWCPIPDLLYVSFEKLGDIILEDDACPIPPDLAIEVISPGQSFSELSEKAEAYLKAGVDRVWLIDIQVKKITIFYPDSPPQTKQSNDSLGDDLLPNLSLTPQEIFEKAGLI